MKDINIYMATCDKTSHVLKVTIPLWEKYWNISKSIKILGFTKPDVKLPVDFSFISMETGQDADEWARGIYSVIKNDPNEFIIFTLDDFLPIDYINTEILEYFFSELERDQNLVRCALGIDLSFQPNIITESRENYTLIEQAQFSPYRITTQTSIWRKDYLLNFLSRSTNPWNFETSNNPLDGKRIIGTIGRNAFRYIEEGALSKKHPNKFNILGMRFDDVRWLLNAGFVDENKLQFGIYVGNVPQFSKYGFDFKLDVLKSYVSELKYREYLIKYEKYYDN